MNSILASALIDVLLFTGKVSPEGWRGVLIGMVQAIPCYTLVPRFILNLRKLYARDLRVRRGSEIDTGFRFTSAFGHSAATSTIMFAESRQNEGEEQGDEIQMEDREFRGASDSSA